MRFTSPSRRAAGLLAVSTIGLSTAVLSVTGVASANTFEPDGTAFTFTTAEDSSYDLFDTPSLEIPEDYCSVTWKITGGSGGADTEELAGEPGGSIQTTTDVLQTATYTLAAGGRGGNGDSQAQLAGNGGSNFYDQDAKGGSGYFIDDPDSTYFGGGGGGGSRSAT